MEGNQVRKNSGEQVISITTRTLKQFQKYNTTQIIRHKFIWRIIYKQNIPNMGVKKFPEENIKVIMEYGLFEINGEKMIIHLA
jgi:hypothetical protein